MTQRKVVAFVPDLMDRSKVAAVAPTTVFVSSSADLAAAAIGADLVVVDLSRPGALDALRLLRDVRTVAFGSHVDAELLAAATTAGASEVLPRSRFFSHLPELLA